jgi:cystathionine beta-lyase
MGEPDLARLRSLVGVKWSRYDDDVLPAWVADMDFDPAPEIKAAIRALVDAGDLGYMALGLAPLTEAWCSWLDGRQGWRPPAEEVWQFTGSLHALEATLALNTEPGDGVAFLSPIYYPFRSAVEDSGRRVVDIPLEPGIWRIDPERLEAGIDAGTRANLFCQPPNPTGRVFDRTELAAVAEVAERRNLIVISDEVWADLTHAPTPHLPLWLADDRLQSRLITLGSASKAFNIAGMRCSLAHVGHEPTRRALQSFSAHLLGGPSTVGAAASIAAWTQAERWLAETSAAITDRRDHIAARLADEAPGIGFTAPEATYLGWLDFSRTALADDPAKQIYTQARVALEPGLKFGPQSGAFARINFATSRAILNDILDRIIGLVRS